MFEQVTIRGIHLQAVQNQQIFAHYLMNERGVQRGKLVAINAEKVVLADNPELAALLAQSEFNYADGISVVCSIKKKYPNFLDLTRIAGADLWQTLMARAAQFAVPVFLIGGQEEVVREVQARLVQQGVKVVGWQNGYFDDEKALLARVVESGARFVSVAMGSPKQEKLMIKLQQVHPDALYMGVGGTYDVFVGRTKRAPLGWQRLGLEWLYRLLQQPTRWQRQKNLLRYAYYHLTNQL